MLSKAVLLIRIILMLFRIPYFTFEPKNGSESPKSCDHWRTDTPRLHFELPFLHCERPGTAMATLEPSKLPNFKFDEDADPDPAFRSCADPDPASQNDAAPNPQYCSQEHFLESFSLGTASHGPNINKDTKP
jgi:hypothetical protein